MKSELESLYAVSERVKCVLTNTFDLVMNSFLLDENVVKVSVLGDQAPDKSVENAFLCHPQIFAFLSFYNI